MSAPHPSRPDETLEEVGEFATIGQVVARFTQGPDVLLGPGDDAAVVRLGGGRAVISTDVLVEGRHFRRDWAPASDIGHRAAAQSLSDLNAMGGRATAVTIGVAAPAGLPVSWLLGLAEGAAAECEAVGASVVGGDLTRGDLLVLAVTAVGVVDGEPVRRSGARPGQVVAVRGRLGWAAAGLAVLGRGFRSPRAVVEAYRRPQVPYGAGAQALAAGASSLIDVSDGLLGDLAHVAAASGVAIDVESASLPVDEPVLNVGAALGVDPLGFVLAGGDDHALVATFPEASAVPEGWAVIGSVHEGAGVTVDGAAHSGEVGYRHF